MNTTRSVPVRRVGLFIALLAGAFLLAVALPRGSAATQSQSAARRCAKGFVKVKGKCVCPKTKVRKGARCVARTVPGGIPGGTSGATPGGAAGTPAGADDGPPFSPPSANLSGQAAADKLLPYLTNATFTDCTAMFPNCAGTQEHRYGFFASGVMYYCRLTGVSGADIINAPAPFQIIGAEQNTTGEWGVTVQLQSYGNTTYYTWDVRPSGAVTGSYWGPGSSPYTDAPTEQLSGLTWVRGARDCTW